MKASSAGAKKNTKSMLQECIILDEPESQGPVKKRPAKQVAGAVQVAENGADAGAGQGAGEGS